MALKKFQSYTLNDNWFEDRSKPLKGVLPDYGYRLFNTAFKEDFPESLPESDTKAARMAKLTMSKSGALLMTREDSYASASNQRECRRTENNFKSVIPRKNDTEEQRYFDTTSKAAFGAPDDKFTSTDRKLLKEPDAPWARGRGGRRPEQGRSTSGAIGEVWKESEHPEKDTATQRSWMYHEDPMIKYRRDGMPPQPEVEATTMPGIGEQHGAPYDPEKNYRRVAGITKYFEPVPKPGSRVFMDDP